MLLFCNKKKVNGRWFWNCGEMIDLDALDINAKTQSPLEKGPSCNVQ